MIELVNVNKYFNRHKKNELHVINNTSLTLEDTGLVALLGPSGCGKTTLLNAIGGLDKIKKGKIYIDNQKISSKFSYKVDKIRNLNVGYIFQDYKLIDNLSVYDNVALVLKMVGIKNKAEIKKRVEYVLDKVGMLRYKKRPAGMLSGGERQRVGIARAIVKDPNIILADEPTGNLDSKNSLEIMKIIKAISKDRLVILVTHERSLAKFYASRIIEIKDGKVIDDYQNDNVDELDYEIDNRFYLKDFKEEVKIKENDIDINIYSDNKEKIKLDLVVKNGNIYIRSNTKDKIEVIDENSSVEFVNEHYKKIAKKDIDKYEFNFKNIIDTNVKKKYSSILNPITLIINGFKKVLDFSFLKKILLIGFLLSGAFIMYAVSTISATLNVKDENFVKENKNYLKLISKKISVDDYLSYENMEDVNYIIPGNSNVKFKVKINDFYQTNSMEASINGSLSDINLIKENDLLLGTMPTNEYEIVVDKLVLTKAFDNDEVIKMSGITDYKEFLNREVLINNMNAFKIVGITDLKSPSIYTSGNVFINILDNSDSDEYEKTLFDYSLFTDKIELKEGRLPNDYEVIVNINNKEEMPINKQINLKVNDIKLTVVGYYYSKNDYNYYFVNNNTIKYNLIKNKSDMMIYSNNKKTTIVNFRNMNLNIRDSYESAKDEYKLEMKESVNNTLLVSGIILVISLIEIYLMIRSSFLSRIKEIGIYRGIGVKKTDIYKMFIGEIIAITTLASVPGLIFSAYVLKVLSTIKQLSSVFLVTPKTVIISIIFVYLFNLIVGLLPVFNVVRKRPAMILARHDLD